MTHTTVLLQKVIDSLSPKAGEVFVDATFGGGGHSRLIARAIGKEGHLIACDQDASVFSKELIKDHLMLTQFTPIVENFRHIGEVLNGQKVQNINGAIFDLGLSSTQLEHSGRGFSFQRDEPLAMTFKEVPEEGDVTAEIILNHWSADSIEAILKGFGDERFARSIAKKIVEQRAVSPFRRTGELLLAIKDATPIRYHHGRTHFATRTFQSLRMAVNDELGVIPDGIRGILPFMVSGSRIAVISFHSVEDRVVKHLFRTLVKDEGLATDVTKKPILPSATEIKNNPRARSAKLRIIQKI